jgi:iron complex transport system substrate-binding protein
MRSSPPRLDQRRFFLNTALALPISLFCDSGGVNAKQTHGNKQRIVCVGSAITEIIYAIDASTMIVGVDTTSSYPKAAQLLPSVGYSRTLSAEGILALSPTQVLLTEDAGPPVVLRQLRDAGLALYLLPARHTFTGICDRVILTGKAIAYETQAEHLRQKLQQQWLQVETEVRGKSGLNPSSRVLYVHSLNPSQIMVSGRNTNADAMIHYAGLSNALSGFKGYKPLTPEAVIAANPDIILITDQGIKAIGGITSLAKLPGIEKTSAMRFKRIISMDAVYLLGFGPRMPEAVLTLRRAALRAFG